MLVMQEWGACYFDSANNNCQQSGVLNQTTRGSNIKNWGKQITDSGIPWMYWCVESSSVSVLETDPSAGRYSSFVSTVPPGLMLTNTRKVLPGADPHYGWDYEVGIDDQGWDAILDASAYAASQKSAWDFSPWLLGAGGESSPSEPSAPVSTSSSATEAPEPTTDAPAPSQTTGNFPKNKVFSGSKYVLLTLSSLSSLQYLLSACITLQASPRTSGRRFSRV